MRFLVGATIKKKKLRDSSRGASEETMKAGRPMKERWRTRNPRGMKEMIQSGIRTAVLN